MDKIENFIGNDYVYYSFIVLFVIVGINIFSKFINNVVLIVKILG